MIDRNEVYAFVEKRIADTDLFLVDVTIGTDNRIVVEVASEQGVSIDSCVELTRSIESAFDRDVEDYELEVGSAGLTSPFKVARQYAINKGHKIEVLTVGGEKLHGVLADSNNEGFDLLLTQKVKKENAKRQVEETVTRHFLYADVKYTRCEIDF